ncbi:hypothetical protein SH203_01105 [Brevundimonas sp. SH203]|uniref:DUF4153 domain-containing protein n=1 Tax=Brevundimonas sp. SH203 TaxID=345167 RepID=UPI0009C81934|nr:DUF4153 domain-containing protein [Brevundimonas sp. SH203]GAW40705.1 hypothetical protein SH203_01105 [Brevundimonas sp. SH203]
MTETLHQDTGRTGLGGASGLFAIRLATGLVQGLALYLLYLAADGRTWPATQPALFGALALAAGYGPVTVLAAAGRIKPAAVILWTIVAAAVLALLGAHDVARQALEPSRQPPFLSFSVLAFGAAALFIAHHLIVPTIRERRWIVDYPEYFDLTWKAGVQLVLSLGFTAAFWILLHLGAALFGMIGLTFLRELLGEAWFAIPVTALTFATAVQLTDVRDGLIRGVRTVALMLLSWLLLVMTVLVAGFLAALPFTGLDGLWETRSATALVLSAAAALIVLINTAYQDGRADNLPPRVLRYGVRVASVLIAPLIVLAVWGLALRIGQHGLTPDRIIAAACTLVGTVYGAGYLLAAVRPGGWMRPLERTNVLSAVLSVLVILALFSPLADPARMSVKDQVARLERGAVPVGDFDYDFLRFESGKVGVAALEKLTRSTDAEVARLARAAKARDYRSGDTPKALRDRAAAVRLRAAPGQTVPASFTRQLDRHVDQLYACIAESPCVVRTLPFADGRPHLLLAAGQAILAFVQEPAGDWRMIARYQDACGAGEDLKAGLTEGATPTPATLPDLTVGGRTLQATPEVRCGASN